jgi:hypothetical protein
VPVGLAVLGTRRQADRTDCGGGRERLGFAVYGFVFRDSHCVSGFGFRFLADDNRPIELASRGVGSV